MSDHDNRNDHELLEQLAHEFHDFLAIIQKFFGKRYPISATFILRDSKGDFMGAPATIQVGGSGAKASFAEFDQFGQPINGPGPINFSSSDPAIATIDASGNVVAVAAGTCTLSATDAGDNLTDSVALTVTPAPPPPPPVPTHGVLTVTPNP